MAIIDTGIVVIPDLPHSWGGHIRSSIEAIELGMGDRYAFHLLLDWDAHKSLELARAVHGMKALKGPKKYA